jgi:hypothetical protein
LEGCSATAREGIKRVAQIQLVIAALEIELRLLDRDDCGRSGNDRLFLGANVLHTSIRHPNFVEDRLNNFTIGARQYLAKDSAGNLHKQGFALGTIQARGLKPGCESVDADPGLHAFQEFVPGVHRFLLTPKLSGCGHRKENTRPALFPQMFKSCGKRAPLHLSIDYGFQPSLESAVLPCP